MSRIALDPPVTCFESAHGYPYEGFMIPFGALVWCRDTGGKSFEPKGSPAVYLGAELIKGMKYKGIHKVWPLKHIEKGSIFVYVVRTLAFPNGKWQFPLRESKDGVEMIQIDDMVPPPELSDVSGAGDCDGEEGSGRETPKEPLEHEMAQGDPTPKKRNRSITAIRIAIHGATPKCEGCKEGTYSHTLECRKRFNELIDNCEPLHKDKVPDTGAHGVRASGEEGQELFLSKPAQSAVGGEEDEDRESDGYVPTTPRESELGDFDFEDPDETVTGEAETQHESPETSRALIATGRKSSELATLIEKGPSVVASIFFDAIEIGGMEEIPLSERLANAMNALPRPKAKRSKQKVVWFVEFACSKNSACSKLAAELGIPYIGFSMDVCDLSDPLHIEQIMM